MTLDRLKGEQAHTYFTRPQFDRLEAARHYRGQTRQTFMQLATMHAVKEAEDEEDAHDGDRRARETRKHLSFTDHIEKFLKKRAADKGTPAAPSPTGDDPPPPTAHVHVSVEPSSSGELARLARDVVNGEPSGRAQRLQQAVATLAAKADSAEDAQRAATMLDREIALLEENAPQSALERRLARIKHRSRRR